jgi:hypothetical protein
VGYAWTARALLSQEKVHDATIGTIVDRSLILLDRFAILLSVPQRGCKPLKM